MCLLASLVFSSPSRFLSFSFSMPKRIWTHCAWERASAIVQIDDCRHPAGRSVFLLPSLPYTHTTDENQAKRWERDEEKNVKIASWFEGQNVSWETETEKKKTKTMARQRHQDEARWQRTDEYRLTSFLQTSRVSKAMHSCVPRDNDDLYWMEIQQHLIVEHFIE